MGCPRLAEWCPGRPHFARGRPGADRLARSCHGAGARHALAAARRGFVARARAHAARPAVAGGRTGDADDLGDSAAHDSAAGRRRDVECRAPSRCAAPRAGARETTRLSHAADRAHRLCGLLVPPARVAGRHSAPRGARARVRRSGAARRRDALRLCHASARNRARLARRARDRARQRGHGAACAARHPVARRPRHPPASRHTVGSVGSARVDCGDCRCGAARGRGAADRGAGINGCVDRHYPAPAVALAQREAGDVNDRGVAAGRYFGHTARVQRVRRTALEPQPRRRWGCCHDQYHDGQLRDQLRCGREVQLQR